MGRIRFDRDEHRTRSDDYRLARQTLRTRDAWLSGQNEAFKAAINGASLHESLGILISTAIEQLEAGSRCAFYIANEEGSELRHVVGMPEAYARYVDGFPIGPDSLACGLALNMAAPVITADVRDEPRWKPWLWLAEEFNYRGCWSFPVETTVGELVGTFAMYFARPRKPGVHELELAKAMTHAAAIIIVQHQSHAQLQMELEDATRLQAISAELVHEESVEALYEKILDAAIAITHSEFASLQKLYPERGERGELRLLASRGFDREAMEHWRWITAESRTTCGAALRTGVRAVVRDLEDATDVVIPIDLESFRRLGIRGGQTTPLVSRGGQLVGMLSSHWRKPHTPRDRELRLLDVLARQAADLIERAETNVKLQANEERLHVLVGELQHRTRNLMAVIRSMTLRTVEESTHLSDFETAFLDRLDALARAQRLLARLGDNDRITFDELIASEMTAMGAEGRVTLEGPRGIRLRSSTVQTLAMAMHELATNAIKHGALGQPTAKLAVRWSVGTLDALGRPRLHIDWRESGVDMRSREPSRGTGRGRELIEESLPYQLEAETRFSLEPDGAHCTITIPVSATSC